MAALREATPAALAHYKQARTYLKQKGLDECLKVYVSWDSRKQAIKLKLWNVPQANRGKLSELGFKFVSPLYGPRELSAIVYINADGVVMSEAAVAPSRRVVRKGALVLGRIEFVNPRTNNIVAVYDCMGVNVFQAVTGALKMVPQVVMTSYIADGCIMRAA